MHRHIEHAYDALCAEHQRIHRIHIRLLAQGDVKLERSLRRGSLEDDKYIDTLLDFEEQVTYPKQRSVLRLNRYGVKIENLMDALLKLETKRIGLNCQRR
jgi:hypothetical protein